MCILHNCKFCYSQQLLPYLLALVENTPYKIHYGKSFYFRAYSCEWNRHNLYIFRIYVCGRFESKSITFNIARKAEKRKKKRKEEERVCGSKVFRSQSLLRSFSFTLLQQTIHFL